jgi:hypothetical protein
MNRLFAIILLAGICLRSNAQTTGTVTYSGPPSNKSGTNVLTITIGATAIDDLNPSALWIINLKTPANVKKPLATNRTIYAMSQAGTFPTTNVCPVCPKCPTCPPTNVCPICATCPTCPATNCPACPVCPTCPTPAPNAMFIDGQGYGILTLSKTNGAQFFGQPPGTSNQWNISVEESPQ